MCYMLYVIEHTTSSGARGDDVLYAICYKAHHVLENIIPFSDFLALFFYLKQFIFCICLFCLPVYLYTMYVPGIYRDPKRVLDPLELELQL